MPLRALSPAAASPGALWTELAPAGALAQPLPADTLAAVAFAGAPDVDDPRFIRVGMAELGGPAQVELWRSAQPVTWGRDGGIGFARDPDVLIGSLTVLEVELGEVAAATFRAYARIIAFLERQEYPWLLRCWNFIHDINRGDINRGEASRGDAPHGNDSERYKQFCVGRYRALSAVSAFEHQLPAGTAIGMAEPGLVLYFMAAREPGRQVENPRQTPAFRYPRQYGPRSPSFSRATFKPGPGADQLLVSGTASVVGHATQHAGNPAAQLQETLANLDALLRHAAEQHLGRADPSLWRAETLKLYLRNRADYPAARAQLEQALGAAAPVAYLEGEICRRDLQLEIEGAFAAPRT